MKMTKSRSTDCINVLGGAKEDPSEIKKYKQKLDLQMETIMSQLMLFESYLRKEQSQIQTVLHEKDNVIAVQRETILKLANKNEQLRHAYVRMKSMLQNMMNKREYCVLECNCICHSVSDAPLLAHNDVGNGSELTVGSHDDLESELTPRTEPDDEIRKLNSDAIQECTISLNTSISRPRRVVERGSIKELAKHHRQRRASGGNSFMENGSKSSVTRSNSLPDAKLLYVMEARARNLVECSSTHTTRLPAQETMPLLHSETVLSQIVHNDSNPENQKEKSERFTHFEGEETVILQNNFHANAGINVEMGETHSGYLDDTDDDEPPQFYDIDDENVLKGNFGMRSGKFKHVKSPPNPSPNKNPRRPKEHKKRHKLKSNPNTEKHYP